MKYLNNEKSNRQSWPMKVLAAAVAITMTATVAQSASAATVLNRKPIGDLEIYALAKPGTASILLMLDTSGSMDVRSIRDDYGTSFSASCSESSVAADTIKAVIYKRKLDPTQEDGLMRDESGNTVKDFSSASTTITFIPKGCTSSKVTRYSRMTRLKSALIELLADNVYDNKNTFKETGSLSDDYQIGLGNFGPNANRQVGKISIPTKPLTAEQRIVLITEIQKLEPVSWTPTAQALAESGAYMLGTTTLTSSSTYKSYSGMDLSANTTKKAGNQTYVSPLSTKECSGNGIYLLTDGEPNKSSNAIAKTVMNKSLEGSPGALSVTGCSGLSGGNSEGAWGCMADYAALLRNTDSNSRGLPIKTATVGFGKDFAGLTGKRNIIVNGESKEVVDCDSGTATQDTRNLCKLGERKGDGEPKTFGDGGFYYTEESEDIANSIVDFVSGLVQVINTAPSGTITIPDDPYQAANQLPYAYLPMLNPDIGSAASVWDGNLKKYDLNQGTLFGKGANKLYKNVGGDIKEETQDLWQTNNFISDGKTANNDIKAGGVYAQLSAPNSGLASMRTVYVEDYTSSGDKTPTLRKLGVASNGKPQGFELLVDKNETTGTYTQLNKRRLISFLGFDSVLKPDGQAVNTTTVESLTLTKPTKEIKVLGGVVHSKPAALSYSATLDDNGNITKTRDDYVLFGSMDGALHLVDAADGKEVFAIIPKLMVDKQPTALVDNSTKSSVGEPYFGVDAPWLVTTDYKYDLASKKVKVDDSSGKGMFAYGGLRMGGEALYGLDISNKSAPKIMFTLTPTARNNVASNDFARLGHIWSKPTAAKIRRTADSEPLDVLIFGGGYDMQYEEDDYVPTTTAPAKGSAIYMVNAKTGELIWSTSSAATSGKNVKTDSMINSITGGITVLDRDNDGLMDHIYAADLGGQVFRADFENARPAKYGFTAVSSFSNKRVIRVLNAAPSDAKLAYRFYERPIVSFYRNEGISGQTVANNGKLFAVVNVISGNRSAPLSVLRDNNLYANRIYGIIDDDLTKVGILDNSFTPTLKDITESSLVNLDTTLGATPTPKVKEDTKAVMIKGTKKGWYYPLTRFDGYTKVRYNKGVGDSVVINNLLYTTVYNPDKFYGDEKSCTARISGGSERQLYCLPYGICMDAESKSGTGGYLPVGQGIQELTLGSYNDKNTDKKVLIGTTTITERIQADQRTGYGSDAKKNASDIQGVVYPDKTTTTQAGGDGTAAEFIFNERYTLQPNAWYEQKQQP